MHNTIGIDVGGTKIAGGIVTPSGQLVQREEIKTPAGDPEDLFAAIVAVCAALDPEHHLPVGVAAAGYIDAAGETILFSPNIAWRNEPLQHRLQERMQTRVVLANDANAAAWAEYRVGAGAARDEDMLMLTLGTGVGGGIVCDGKLLTGAHGIAAEIGHMQFVQGGRLCGCGRRGCLEQYASGQALDRLVAQRTAESEDESALHAPGQTADGRAVKKFAQAGDPLALAILQEFGHLLGNACASLTSILDPQLIVFGGGATENGAQMIAFAQDHLETLMAGARPVPHLVLAQAGSDAGIIGAGLLAPTR